MSKDSRPSRRQALLGDRPGSYAIARQVRMSPTKIRRVVDMIRGMDVEDALNTCQFRTPGGERAGLQGDRERSVQRRADRQPEASRPVRVAGVRGPGGHDPTDPPAGQGRCGRILKRSSHITVVVEPRTEAGTRGQATTRSKEK